MLHMPGTFKRSEPAREARKPPHGEKTRSRGRARRYLLVFAPVLLACLLCIRLGPLRADESVGKGGRQASTDASGSASSPGQSLARPAAIPAPQSTQGPEDAGGPAVRAHMSRSQARSAALVRLMGHLPQAYLTRQGQSEGASSAEGPAPPNWPVQEGGARKPASDKAASGRSPGLEAAPSGTLDDIPLSISMLVYSKQADERWANIDGLKVREGEQMVSGPKVEEITPDGVVLSYQGRRFYKAVK